MFMRILRFTSKAAWRLWKELLHSNSVAPPALRRLPKSCHLPCSVSVPVSSKPHPSDSDCDRRTVVEHFTTNVAGHDEKHFIKLKLCLNTVITVTCTGTASPMCYSDTWLSVHVSSGICSFIYPNKVVRNSCIFSAYTRMENSNCKFPFSKQSFYFYLSWRVKCRACHGERSCTNKNTVFKECFGFFFNKILSCSYLYK